MHALFDVYNRADAKINFIQPALTVNVLGHYRYSVKTLLEAFLRNKKVYPFACHTASQENICLLKAHTHTCAVVHNITFSRVLSFECFKILLSITRYLVVKWSHNNKLSCIH